MEIQPLYYVYCHGYMLGLAYSSDPNTFCDEEWSLALKNVKGNTFDEDDERNGDFISQQNRITKPLFIFHMNYLKLLSNIPFHPLFSRKCIKDGVSNLHFHKIGQIQLYRITSIHSSSSKSNLLVNFN